MAHSRLLNEDLILSKKINSVSEGAENLYYRIYVSSDDFGRYHAKPEIIKGKIYTLRKISTKEIARRINELWLSGLIDIYNEDGESYLEIVKFEKYQKFRTDIRRRNDYPKPVTYSERPVTDAKRPETSQKVNLSLCNRSRSRSRSRSNNEREDKDTLIKIITYFNDKTGQKRGLACDETVKLINGRLAEGRTFEDFKRVIDVKTHQWRDDPKMSKYLRPSTLFRPGNFEDYLNEETIEDRDKKRERQAIESTRKQFLDGEITLEEVQETERKYNIKILNPGDVEHVKSN